MTKVSVVPEGTLDRVTTNPRRRRPVLRTLSTLLVLAGLGVASVAGPTLWTRFVAWQYRLRGYRQVYTQSGCVGRYEWKKD